MNLADAQFSDLSDMFRNALVACQPNHHDIDIAHIFNTCLSRGMQCWKEAIEPELDSDKANEFGKALWRVKMKPESAIPWPMAFGYAFGAACYESAGGPVSGRDEGAITSGLGIFLVGLFDHMLDKHPREFANMGSKVTPDKITQYTLERDLTLLNAEDTFSLPSCYMDLYGIYFARCHKLLGASKRSSIAIYWHDMLQKMHEAERNSLGWRISKLEPTSDMIEVVETPGTYSQWVIALSSCLSLGMSAVHEMEITAKKYIRLTRLVDAVMDIEEDTKNDIWGGMNIRIALEAKKQSDVERLVLETAEECVQLWQNVAHVYSKYKWDSSDKFTLADILWAYLWRSAGGYVQGISHKLNGRGERIEE